MIETIGKIQLDLTKYPGQDFYCDGAVEDEILQIVRDLSPVEYAKEIEERKSWPILYHLSPLRQNIVDWLPMDKGMKVLEVGSGCGAITGALSRKAGSVTCVELSKKRSTINAYRNSECDNVTIKVGNFKDIEPELPCDFDYICLIGVFEYGQSYIGGDNAYEDFLKILMRHLAKGGRIVIAIENKYGLKYFAGCKEDHLGTYFSGLENYKKEDGVCTFGRKGLERIFEACGVEEYHFYYPYPDYKFMTTLHSDYRLPGKGELSNNLRNFDRDRMQLFDEKAVYDGMIEEKLYDVFANSYMAILGADIDTKYAKYSNDRSPDFCIRTEILVKEDGSQVVRKYPLGEEAKAHVQGMKVAYESLEERFAGGKLHINPCTLVEIDTGIYAEFPFEKGIPLSELMDACLDRDDTDGFHALFQEYLERISYRSEVPVADFDLIFANLLVDGDTWTLIDYEWTFGKPMDPKELAFRAVYCYLLEDEKRNRLDLDRILSELAITEADAEAYRAQEMEFQNFVTGKRMSMAQMRENIGNRVINPMKWMKNYQENEAVNRVQIYEDCGNGYSEEDSYFVKDAYQGDSLIELELEVSGNVHMLRIDPSMCSCLVKVQEMTFNGERVPLERRKVLYTNGRVIKNADGKGETPSIAFATDDPNININLTQLNRQAKNLLTARMEVVKLPMEMAKDMAK